MHMSIWACPLTEGNVACAYSLPYCFKLPPLLWGKSCEYVFLTVNDKNIIIQVFGKLLEWNRSFGNDSGGESLAGAEDVAADADDSDLREHVVGILFAGHKLTSLQTQVRIRTEICTLQD